MQTINVGEKLRAFFKKAGLTQEVVAERLGVSQAYVNALLNNKKQFGKKQAYKWGELFGISPNWLLTGEGEMLKPAKNPFSQMTEQEIEEITKSAITDELVKAYERGEIYPAVIHDRIVAEKNAELKEKDALIGELQRRVWELEQKAGKKG